jgi:hypothetical protein
MRKASNSATKNNLRLYQISTLITLFCFAAKIHGLLLTNFFLAKFQLIAAQVHLGERLLNLVYFPGLGIRQSIQLNYKRIIF